MCGEMSLAGWIVFLVLDFRKSSGFFGAPSVFVELQLTSYCASWSYEFTVPRAQFEYKLT